MNRKRMILASAALPAVLAIAVATGAAFAQMPDGHHAGGDGAMQMHAMMQAGGMQAHMREMLGEDGYARMLGVMANHGASMVMGNDGMSGMSGMSADGMDAMMAAMEACLRTNSEVPGAPGGGGHEEHHPGTATP